MKKTIVEITCDVCKAHMQVDIKRIAGELTETVSGALNQRLQVIFTTDQNDGSVTKPYLSNSTLDLCEKRLSRRLAGESIFAHGAMSNNTYYFNGDN